MRSFILPLEKGILCCFFHLEANWDELVPLKQYATCKTNFNETIKVPITLVKYAHARLKSFDDWFASNPTFILHALDWIER